MEVLQNREVDRSKVKQPNEGVKSFYSSDIGGEIYKALDDIFFTDKIRDRHGRSFFDCIDNIIDNT